MATAAELAAAVGGAEMNACLQSDLWLQENVLFGKPFDPVRYDAVLKSCALEGERR